MPTMTDEQVLEKEPYQSILNLLDFCHPVEITHGQILYALSIKPKKDKGIEKSFEKIRQTPFQKLFQYSFKELYDAKKYSHGFGSTTMPPQILRCSISASALDEKLNLLINRGFVKADGRPRYRTYTVSHKFNVICKKIQVEKEMKIWHHDNMMAFTIKHGDGLLESSDILVCGLPIETFKKMLPKNETKKFMQLLYVIDKNIYKILEMKYNVLKMSEKEYYKKIVDHLDSPGFDMQLNDIGFYYHASKKMIEKKK